MLGIRKDETAAFSTAIANENNTKRVVIVELFSVSVLLREMMIGDSDKIVTRKNDWMAAPMANIGGGQVCWHG